MDRSLWLLLWLRINATLRRFRSGFGSLKGIILAVVGGLSVVSALVPMLMAPKINTAGQHEAINRYGPLALLVYCVLNVILSSGDRAVTYTPAEVSFLFSGPYRPRQLLLYKIAAALATSVLTAFFATFLFAHHATRWLCAYISLFFTLGLLYLFGLAVGLLCSTVGTLVLSRVRLIVLCVVLGALAISVFPLLGRARDMPPIETIHRVVDSPTMGFITAPFRPFVHVFTADQIWPDLASWSLVAAAVDLVFLSIVLGLNSQFLEASARSSERIYAVLLRARKGQIWPASIKAHFEIPMFPWLGGVGPNLWRQITSASRSIVRLIAILLLFLIPVVFVLTALPTSLERQPGASAVVALSVLASVALFAPTMIGFDFRPDIHQIEDLKTLPMGVNQLVIGQLVAPVVILCLGEWLAIGVVAIFAKASAAIVIGSIVIVLPMNFLLVAIENLYCLWFPFRMAAINSFDLQAMGRQLLLLLAKGFSLGTVGGLAGGLGVLVYYVSGSRLDLGIVASWLVMASMGLGLVPLVGLAFEQFDVAQTMPE